MYKGEGGDTMNHPTLNEYTLFITRDIGREKGRVLLPDIEEEVRNKLTFIMDGWECEFLNAILECVLKLRSIYRCVRRDN